MKLHDLWYKMYNLKNGIPKYNLNHLIIFYLVIKVIRYEGAFY